MSDRSGGSLDGKRKLFTAGLVALLLAIAPFAGAGEGSPILATGRSESNPAVSIGYMAWSQNSAARPKHMDLFAKQDGAAKFKVNAPRTEGFGGNIDGSTLVYTQWRNGRGDIKFFNLEDRTRSDPPAGVNTQQHESRASKSGDWILFRRSRHPSFATQRILLRNLSTGDQQLLGTGDGDRQWAMAGGVSGDYVSWSECRGLSHCNVFRYDIAGDTRQKVPNARGLALFASSVTSDGTVYFAQSSNLYCGRNIGIYAFPIGGPKVRLASLGDRRLDVAQTIPLVNVDKSVSVFYDRSGCNSINWDIYKVDISALGAEVIHSAHRGLGHSSSPSIHDHLRRTAEEHR